MNNIKYICQKCFSINRLPNIDTIKNSPLPSPICCNKCGEHFSKDKIVNFAKQRAKSMIQKALKKMDKHIHREN